MKVISEAYLRLAFKSGLAESFQVEPGQILTPSAAQYLAERGIAVVRDKTGTAPAGDKKNKDTPTEPPKAHAAGPRFIGAGDGGAYEEKPEHMTQLHGNRLVPKDHPRIQFRGKLDSLQSAILELQHKAHAAGSEKLVQDLADILGRAREIMRAEVLDQPLPESGMLGLSDGELRHRSHHPKRYFGVSHILPSHEMGARLLALNRLRSDVREVEVAAVRAFRNDLAISKTDIIQALNRMSSAVYIAMLKEQSGLYR